MRLGQTSLVHLASQVTKSVVGFAATLAITNLLGREPYGTWVVFLSVLTWVSTASTLGIPTAVQKRESEETAGNWIVAGMILLAVVYVIVVVALVPFQSWLNGYIGADIARLLFLFLGIRILIMFLKSALDGQHLVHISSLLDPVQGIVQSGLQIVLLLLSYGLMGVFFGWIVGGVVTVLVGGYFLSVRFSLPDREAFRSLVSFARYSWLSGIKGRTFTSMDVLVLAYFAVGNGLIGVYGAAWNLAMVLALFGKSIQRAMFPAISSVSAMEGLSERVEKLLESALAYSGLFVIPGLAGSAVVGDRVLSLYGDGFTVGHYVLIILVASQLIYVYQVQFGNTLSAVDRPDLRFRVDVTFIGTNLVLNLVLGALYGWYGTAVATLCSAIVACVLSFGYVRRLLTVEVPLEEVGRQILSAGVMAAVVFGVRRLVGVSIWTTGVLVAGGAAVYFGTLFGVSPRFRRTIKNNVPAWV